MVLAHEDDLPPLPPIEAYDDVAPEPEPPAADGGSPPPWPPPPEPDPPPPDPDPVPVDTLPARLQLPYTDLGNARRFDLLYGQDVRWCDARERWLAWEGTRWAWDDRRLIHAMAQGTVDRLRDEVLDLQRRAKDERDPERRVALEERVEAAAKHATKSQATARVSAIQSEARALPGRPIAIQDLDADPWVLNAQNVTLDLRTGDARAHRRQDLLTHQAAVPYVEGAWCPTWEAFLRQIFPDMGDVVAFLRRSVGYCLTGDVSEQKFWVLLGDGANGKSTFLEVVMWLLGSYARPLAPGFLEQKRNDDGHPTDVADLQGARFTASSEVKQGRSLDESKVKRLTGGDRVKARFMNQDFFEFDPTHKLWLATNHRLRVRGADHGIWRRTIVVPFGVQIPEDQQDPHLKDKLKAEGPGILNWALQGLTEWKAGRLAPPRAVMAAVEDYRNTEDLVGAFVSECCAVDERFRGKVSDLYDAYRRWFEASGQLGTPMAKRELSEALGKRGFADYKGGKGERYRLGLTVAPGGADRHDEGE